MLDIYFAEDEHISGDNPKNTRQFSKNLGNNKKDLQKKTSNVNVKISHTCANKIKARWFINEECRLYLLNKHLYEFSVMSEADYLNTSMYLLESAVTKGVVRGYKKAVGSIVRYNPIKNGTLLEIP